MMHKRPLAFLLARDQRMLSASSTTTPHCPSVSVVVPALNEARNLPHVLPKIPAWVSEVLLVDGGSSDETIQVARMLRPDIRIVSQPGRGKGDALRAGFSAAESEIIVMLDADGSMCPGEIESYVRMLLLGYDFVRGSRFMSGGSSRDITPPRFVGNKCLLWLVRALLGGSYTDLCYGYAAFRRDILPVFRLADESDHLGFEIETLLGIRAIAGDLRIAEVPSTESMRVHGRSHLHALRDGWRVLQTILREHANSKRAIAPQARHAAGANPSTLDVSVVICAHYSDRWDDLVSAVGSLLAQQVPAVEIIVVVDNNPKLLERVRHQFPEVHAVPNGNAPGNSGARNTGVMLARGEVIAFLDDDGVAAVDWIEQLQRGYHDPAVMAVGGVVQPDWSGSRPRWLPVEYDWVIGCTHRGAPEIPSRVRNLVGCNMSFRRDVFEPVSGFRSDLGRLGENAMGCDETEFCVRVNRVWPWRTILFQPEARVRHRIRAQRQRWSYFCTRCIAEGRGKARLSRIAGIASSTVSERAYVIKTLPSGILREVVSASRGDAAGLIRAAVIVVGLALTTFGYVVDWLIHSSGRLMRRPTSGGKRTEGLPPTPWYVATNHNSIDT
jgi:glycosyltransferase involved in cell wall biosynthesis